MVLVYGTERWCINKQFVCWIRPTKNQEVRMNASLMVTQNKTKHDGPSGISYKLRSNLHLWDATARICVGQLQWNTFNMVFSPRKTSVGLKERFQICKKHELFPIVIKFWSFKVQYQLDIGNNQCKWWLSITSAVTKFLVQISNETKPINIITKRI